MTAMQQNQTQNATMIGNKKMMKQIIGKNVQNVEK